MPNFQNYKEMFEERAAIIEFDGGLSRQKAEEKALVEITNKLVEDENLNMSKPDSYYLIQKFKHELKK